MSDAAAAAVVAVSAYLIGSIPFGYLIPKLVKGIDIRDHGSGNPGATNVRRTMGNRWGFLVLFLDLVKGLLPVQFLPALCLAPESSALVNVSVLAGVAAIVGHMLPCYLQFRGGKGVATALGVVIVLSPWGALAGLVAFAVSFAIWRMVSLSSISAALLFAVAQLIVLYPYSPSNWSLLAFSLAIPALIIFRHRSNIERILSGKEERTDFRKRPSIEDQQSPGNAGG